VNKCTQSKEWLDWSFNREKKSRKNCGKLWVTHIQTRICLLKLIHSEKATKFCEIFTLLLTTVHTVKSKVKILWPSQNIWTLLNKYSQKPLSVLHPGSKREWQGWATSFPPSNFSSWQLSLLICPYFRSNFDRSCKLEIKKVQFSTPISTFDGLLKMTWFTYYVLKFLRYYNNRSLCPSDIMFHNELKMQNINGTTTTNI
jgi:hypothetical protein